MPVPLSTESSSAMHTLPSQEVAMLARAYGRQVFQAAFRVLGATDQAEDVQQELFLRLMEKPISEVSSWPALLTSMSVRMAIDRLRKRQRWHRLLPTWRATAPTTAPSAEEDALQAEKAIRLRHAISRLRPREAQCFTLRCLEGMELATIASTTGMTVNHVSVCLHRATRALENLLGDAANSVPETL